MTVAKRENLRKNILTIVPVTTLVLVIGFIWRQAQWQEGVDKELEIFREHVISNDVHRTYQDNVKDFAPRGELNILLLNIQNNQLEIKQDIKSIEKKLNEL
jgi:cell division protein FtsL